MSQPQQSPLTSLPSNQSLPRSPTGKHATFENNVDAADFDANDSQSIEQESIEQEDQEILSMVEKLNKRLDELEDRLDEFENQHDEKHDLLKAQIKELDHYTKETIYKFLELNEWQRAKMEELEARISYVEEKLGIRPEMNLAAEKLD